jgi:hypothetical protein
MRRMGTFFGKLVAFLLGSIVEIGFVVAPDPSHGVCITLVI